MEIHIKFDLFSHQQIQYMLSETKAANAFEHLWKKNDMP